MNKVSDSQTAELVLNELMYSPRVERYLKDLILEGEKRPMAIGIGEFGEFMLKTHLDGEPYVSDNDQDNKIFVYLKQIGAIDAFKPAPFAILKPDEAEHGLAYPEVIWVEVADLQKLKDVYEKILEYKRKRSIADAVAYKNQRGENQRRYIIKDSEGNFYYGKENLLINFPNHNVLYYKIFSALYDLSQSNEVVTYKDAGKFLEKNFKVKKSSDPVQMIRNAINNSLRDKHGKYNLPETYDGRPMIQTIRGIGIKFYNPVI